MKLLYIDLFCGAGGTSTGVNLARVDGEEFMSWGDVDANGKPISMDKGKAYCRWVRNVKKYGYNFEHRILNAADFGAYTSRKRFFGIFAKDGLPITFPEATHAKKPESNLFGSLKRWKPVKDVLDFSDEGRSIFYREKPLSEKTLERIFAGLVKFVAGGKDKFIVKYNSMNQAGKYQAPSVDEPCPVVATQNRLAIAQVSFMSKQFSGHPESKNCSIDEPAGTITCVDHHAFVTAFYGNGNNHSIEAPAPTLTTKEKFAVVNSVFFDMQYGNGTSASVETAAGALTANPKHKLITVKFPLDAPCYAIPIMPDDSPMTIKIKDFMALYGIIDIKMRMLKISELKLIMGFPEDYILVGNQTEQKKFIGNAVEVNMARVLCESLYKSLTPMFATKVAI